MILIYIKLLQAKICILLLQTVPEYRLVFVSLMPMDVESSTLSRYASWLRTLSLSGGLVSADNSGIWRRTGNAACLPELAMSYAIIWLFVLTMRSKMEFQFSSKDVPLGHDGASLGPGDHTMYGLGAIIRVRCNG